MRNMRDKIRPAHVNKKSLFCIFVKFVETV